MTSAPSISRLALMAATWELTRWQLLDHLCRKELAESKPVIIASVAIYWLMPALWLILWMLFYRGGGGFFVALMVATGWFYAIVVGAHTVCRDWGRSEGLFLQARPVSPRMIVAAKLIAGLATVVFAAIPALIEGLVLVCLALGKWMHGDWADWSEILVISIFTLWAIVAGYFLAFAAAFITRQTLSSVLISVLVLVMWLAAPLFSSKLAFFYPACVSQSWSRPSTAQPLLKEVSRTGLVWWDPGSIVGDAYLVTVGLVLVGCVLTSFIVCSRERVISLSHRRLAWVVAVIVLAFFGLAMNEVGNSLEVTDQAQSLPACRIAWDTHASLTFVQRNGQCYGLGDRNVNREGYFPRIGEQGLIRFDVSPEGRVRDVEQVYVQSLVWPDGMLPESPDVKATQRLFLRSHSSIVVDESGDLVVTGFWWGRPLEEIHRVTIRWPVRETPRVVGHQVAICPRELLKAGWSRSVAYALTEHHAYVRYNDWPGSSEVADDRIWRFDFGSDSAWTMRITPAAEYKRGSVEHEAIIDSPARAEGSTGGCPPVWEDEQPHRLHLKARDLRRRSAEEGLRVLLVAVQEADVMSLPSDSQFDSPGLWWIGQTSTAVLPGTGLTCQGDRTGLSVSGNGDAWPAGVVGTYQASPLAMLWRGSSLELAALGNSRVAEWDNQTVSLYDLSDPTRPRRIGFLNRFMPYSSVSAQVIDVGHHLVLREGGLLTVLANPPAER